MNKILSLLAVIAALFTFIPTVHAEEDSPYSNATSCPAAEVEAFASKIKNALIANDWNAIADDISYPIRIGKKTYKTKANLLKANPTLPKNFIKEMNDASTTGMFSSYQGIMLGGGASNVWIAGVYDENAVIDENTKAELKIIAINL